MSRVIGVCGLIGSGKGTVGDILVEKHEFQRLSFAKRLKDCTAHLFNWDRKLLEGDTKESREWREKVDPFWSKEFQYEVTPRLILQLIGTEGLRKGLHDNIWVSLVKKYILDNPKGNYVITDVRFRNEQDMIHGLGGEVWQVRKGELPEWFDKIKFSYEDEATLIGNKYGIHQSEYRWIRDDNDFQQIIYNDGTIKDLENKVKQIIDEKS